MMITLQSDRRVLGFAVALLALANSSQAQQTSAADQPPPELQEIIVTAQRVEQSASKVPVAMEVLTGKELTELRINSREDLANQVSGLSVNTSSNGEQNAFFMIRGQGASFGGVPGVTTYFADVPSLAQPTANAGYMGIEGRSGSFLDLENVQVLKGPQGTLFGRNSTGGNVLFVPVKPGSSTDGYIQAGFGNYNDVNVEGAANVPLIDDILYARVALGAENRDGYVKDVGLVNNRALYEALNYRTARVGLVYKPTSNFENYTIVRWYHDDEGGPAFVPSAGNPAINPQYAALVQQQQSRGPWAVADDLRNYTKTEYSQAVNTTTWEVDRFLTLKNIVSYARYSAPNGVDVDGSTLPIVQQTFQYQRQPLDIISTEEIQATGLLLGDHFNYAVGFYTDSSRTPDGNIQEFVFFPVSPAFPLPAPNTVPGVTSTPGFPVISAVTDTTHSHAVYGQVTLDLGVFSSALENLKVTAGERYTWERAHADSYTVLSVIADTVTHSSYENSYPSYTFGLEYQLNPNTLLYISDRDAFKSGGVNAQAVSSLPIYNYAPEKLVSYEAGVKTSFSLPNVAVRIAADVFKGDYTDIQRSVTDPVAVANYTENVARGKVNGAELDLEALIARNLRLSLSYTYLDSAYTHVTNSLAVGELEGAPFPNVPKNHVATTAEYTLPFVPENVGQVALRATYSAQSQITFASTNSGIGVLGPWIPGYSLLDAGISWRDVLGYRNLVVDGYVKNLTDKDYVTARYDFYNTAGFITSIYGPPRTFGMQVRYQFGSRH